MSRPATRPSRCTTRVVAPQPLRRSGCSGPQARSQAGGAVGFTNFYTRIQSVTLQDPRLIGNNTVTATVRFL
jgi:hypothetical protein